MVSFEKVEVVKMEEGYDGSDSQIEEKDTPEVKKYVREMQKAVDSARKSYNFRFSPMRFTTASWYEMIDLVFHGSLNAYLIIQAIGQDEFCDMVYRIETQKEAAAQNAVSELADYQTELMCLGGFHFFKEYTPEQFCLAYNPRLKGDKIKAEPKYGTDRALYNYINKHRDEIIKKLKE